VQPVLLSLCLFLLPVLFCISLLDIALRSVHYYKIGSIHRHGNKNAQRLLNLLSSPEQAISLLLFLRYTLTACLYLMFGMLLAILHLQVMYKLLIIPVAICFGLIQLEYIPRMMAVQNPERIAFLLLRPFELILKLNKLLPLPQGFERFTYRFLRLYGLKGKRIFSEYSINEIKMFLTMSHGKPDPEMKRKMIDTKLVDFSERRVREIMVPRPFVRAIEINAGTYETLRAIQEHGYSRFPVYRSSFDNILGILHVKDIIGSNDRFSLEQNLHKPYFIPESVTVQAAFQNMRRNRVHLAIVVDEYGGVDGIVTLEDVIEELLGEIHDTYDEDIQLLHETNDGSWLIEGNLPLKQLNQNLALNIPEDPAYTTVAGFLLSVFDKIPTEREGVQYGDLYFIVEKMTGNKISKVSLRIPHAKNISES